MNKNLRFFLFATLLVPSISMADIIINPDQFGNPGPSSFGVFPQNLAINPNVVNNDIIIGNQLFINTIFVPTVGELTINGNGTNTAISTNQSVRIGSRDSTRGILNITGNGGFDTASLLTLTNGSINVGGWDGSETVRHLNGVPISLTGTGEINISNGGRIKTNAMGIGSAVAFGSGWTDGNGIGSFDGIVNVTGNNSSMEIGGAGGSLVLGNAASGVSGFLNITGGADVLVKDEFTFSGLIIPNGNTNIQTNSVVTVDGVGSSLTTDLLGLGGTSSQPGIQPAQLNVTNGGRVEVARSSGAVSIVDNSVIKVSGSGSVLEVKGFIVDPQSPSATAGNIHVGGGSSGFSGLADNGTLIVDNGAKVVVENNVVVGGFRPFNQNNALPSSGLLTVNNQGEVQAQNIILQENGRLVGNGGILTSNVIVNGGTIAPGNSPGLLTINGDLTLNSGLLEIEIENTNVFDVLHVTGNLFATNGFDLAISFLNGFMPQDGGSFDFLQIDGVSNLDLSLVNIISDTSTNGFNFALNFQGGLLSVVSTSAVPVPAAVWLFATGLIGLFGASRRKVN